MASADPITSSAEPLVLELRFPTRRLGRARLDRRRLRVLARAILGAEGVTGHVGVSILVVDDEEMQRLNLRHRGVDRPTDVLSFPLEGGAAADGFVTPTGHLRELGDVVVAYPRAVAQAEEFGHSLERELAYLVAHGLLHILGHDHEEEHERLVMRAREEAALVTVGLSR